MKFLTNIHLEKKKYFKINNQYIGLSLVKLNELMLQTEINFPKKPEKVTNSNTSNFSIRNQLFIRNYFLKNKVFDRDYDFSLWINGRDSMIFIDNKKKILRKILINKFNQIYKYIDINKKLIINIHPEYFCK